MSAEASPLLGVNESATLGYASSRSSFQDGTHHGVQPLSAGAPIRLIARRLVGGRAFGRLLGVRLEERGQFGFEVVSHGASNLSATRRSTSHRRSRRYDQVRAAIDVSGLSRRLGLEVEQRLPAIRPLA